VHVSDGLISPESVALMYAVSRARLNISCHAFGALRCNFRLDGCAAYASAIFCGLRLIEVAATKSNGEKNG